MQIPLHVTYLSEHLLHRCLKLDYRQVLSLWLSGP